MDKIQDNKDILIQELDKENKALQEENDSLKIQFSFYKENHQATLDAAKKMIEDCDKLKDIYESSIAEINQSKNEYREAIREIKKLKKEYLIKYEDTIGF